MLSLDVSFLNLTSYDKTSGADLRRVQWLVTRTDRNTTVVEHVYDQEESLRLQLFEQLFVLEELLSQLWRQSDFDLRKSFKQVKGECGLHGGGVFLSEPEMSRCY